MALPFIAGIALGAGIAFAFIKKDEIAKSFKNLNLDKKLQDGINISKSVAKTSQTTRKKPGRKPKETQATIDNQQGTDQ